MTLQDTFYILGIVFMSVMLILIIVLLAAVLVIRNKIVTIQRHIQEKFEGISQLASSGGRIVSKMSEAWSAKHKQK